jgi:hypothetical protein
MQDRMKIPSILIVMYAVLGAVAVTVAAQYPRWPSEPTNEIVIAYWLLGVVYPVGVVIMVARAIPPAKRHQPGGQPVPQLPDASVTASRGV